VQYSTVGFQNYTVLYCAVLYCKLTGSCLHCIVFAHSTVAVPRWLWLCGTEVSESVLLGSLLRSLQLPPATRATRTPGSCPPFTQVCLSP